MNKVSLPGLPAKRAADYDIGNGNYARVIYTPQESKPDRKQIEAQAFQIDANGNFVPADTGVPSRTAGTVHVISVTGIGDTHTLTPGWVRVVGDYNADSLPEGTTIVEILPATADVGDTAYMGDTMYRWDEGMLETILKGKAQELADLIRNSTALNDFEL